MNKKENGSIDMEVFNLAIKQAIQRTEIRVRLESAEQLEVYKRLRKILILSLIFLVLISILLNVYLWMSNI